MLLLAPTLNMLLWLALTALDPQRQFLHDRLAGTRIVDLRQTKNRDKSARNNTVM
jgi:hypothetical protein